MLESAAIRLSASKPAAPQEERALFEADLRSKGATDFGLERWVRHPDQYSDREVQAAWQAWQSRALLTAAPAAPAQSGEPVAWRYLTPTGWHATTKMDKALGASAHHDMEPLYATPQPQPTSAPYLPCPICKGVEGCDHTVPERARAEDSAVAMDEREALQTQIDVLTALREGDHLGMQSLVKERDALWRDLRKTEQDSHDFHEAAAKLVSDMLDAMLAEKGWGECTASHRVRAYADAFRALLTAAHPASGERNAE
jgi:hypothetical protein